MSHTKDNESTFELVMEEESHLYEMHGWALFELKKKCDEVETLQEFTMPEESKQTLPLALRNKDVGTKTGLTFPKRVFMDFMKSSDLFIRQQVTEQNFMTFGHNIIEVTKTLTHNNLELQQLFTEAALQCCNCDKDIVLHIYKLWMEKYLNLKMKGRFTDAPERLDTNSTRKITTKTQNLRDILLTHHVS